MPVHVKCAGDGTMAPLIGVSGTGSGQPTDVDTDAVLFAVFGSGIVDETVAVFVNAPCAFAGIAYVAVIAFVVPFSTVPREQGNDPHAPVTEMSVRPEGVGSLMTTFVASVGPLFLTLIVYAIVAPGVPLFGPDFVI